MQDSFNVIRDKATGHNFKGSRTIGVFGKNEEGLKVSRVLKIRDIQRIIKSILHTARVK